ncbi:hypothetical protein CR513_36146, partial [Mucuna pruriens]
MGIQSMNNIGIYLGYIFSSGWVTTKDFNYVVEKVQTCLASWKGKLLNKVGRLCLTQFVIAYIPAHTMQPFLDPTGTLSLDPKRCNGLGIRDTNMANISLLGNLIWYLLHSYDKPWVQLPKHGTPLMSGITPPPTRLGNTNFSYHQGSKPCGRSLSKVGLEHYNYGSTMGLPA